MTRTSIGAVVFLAVALGACCAQGDERVQLTMDPRAYPGSVFSSFNPPVASLDEPAMGSPLETRSLLILGAHFNQTAETNLNDSPQSGELHSVTRGLGSIGLKRLWKRYETDLDYVGGGAIYGNRGRSGAQIHVFDAVQRIRWHRAQLVFRDSFSYLPEGSFGYGSFGGAAGEGLGGGGLHFGSLGENPRITNEAGAELTTTLTARSALTVSGSYGLIHFTDNESFIGAPVSSPQQLIDNHQISTQAGYSYQLNHEDQVGFIYGFEELDFPRLGAGTFTTHLWHGTYSHRIADRMSLTISAGPQLTRIDNPDSPGAEINRISASGRVALRYSFRATELNLSYRRYVTSGSGFVAGADTNGVRLIASRPLNRKWEVVAELGYSHNRRIQPVDFTTPRTVQSGYAGASVRRHISRDVVGFVRYQFTTLSFDSSFCSVSTSACQGISQRHTGTLGLDWNFKSIQLN